MSLTTHSQSDNLFSTLRRHDVDPKARSSSLVWASAQTLRRAPSRDSSSHQSHGDLSLGWFLSTRGDNRGNYNHANRHKRVSRSQEGIRRSKPRKHSIGTCSSRPVHPCSWQINSPLPRLQSKSESKHIFLQRRNSIASAALRVQFFEAIRRNDQSKVLRMIEESKTRKGDINSENSEVGSYLVNTTDRMGTVPLMAVAASNHGSASMGKMLLRFGALHNKSNLITGESCIHLAAQRGHCRFLSMLLKRRDKSGAFADSNLVTKTGLTALMLASRGGHAHAVDILLNNSADKYKVCKNGMIAKDYAEQAGFSNIVRQLVFGTRIKKENRVQQQEDFDPTNRPLWYLPSNGENGGEVPTSGAATLLVFNTCARGWRSHVLA